MVKTCSVGGCKSRGELIKTTDTGPSFFRFPLHASDPERRKQWANLCGRKDATTGKAWAPKDLVRMVFICSDHFVNGRPSKVKTHPSYLPILRLPGSQPTDDWEQVQTKAMRRYLSCTQRSARRDAVIKDLAVMGGVRGFRKQVPTDVWSVRERLALACSVMRSGDQNWVSVSRAIKSFAEPNRPNDWFSQKNCALQYSDLLEKVETPKRKRADRGETETPGDQIVRKLTIERIEELKRIVQEEQQKYKKLKREVEVVKAGQLDDKLPQIWTEVQQARKTAQDAALAAVQHATEESQARAAAAAARIPGKPVAVPNKPKRPQTGLKLKTPAVVQPEVVDSATTVVVPTITDPVLSKAENIKVEEGSGSSSGQVMPVPSTTQPAADIKPRATPPSSPLLSSLLQNKVELQKAFAVQVPTISQQLLRPHTVPASAAELVVPPPAQPVVTTGSNHQNKVDPVTLPIPTIDIKEEPMDQDLALAIAGEQIIKETISPAVLLDPTPILTHQPVLVNTPAVSLTPAQVSPIITPAPVVVKTEVPSSPSIGAPTLSRLLITPAPSSSTPLKLSTNQSVPPPPPQRPTTTTTLSRARPAPAETKEVTHVPKAPTPEPPPTPPMPTTPKKEKPDKVRTMSVEKELSIAAEINSEPTKVVPFLMEDEPASPASSVVSNETDSGSAKGVRSTGRKGGRRGKGSRRISQRITRGRIQEDEKAVSSGKPSEAESSDDEVNESDDGTSCMTPKLTLSMSESVPNSPASISQCDTEDEKAYKVWKKSIMLVWRAAANHKYANVFLHPVTNEMAPGYLNVVSRPMDLSMIKKNIESGALRTTAEFQRDMMLMFTNAIMYNNSDHDVYNMAVEMYNDVMVHIEQYVNTQMMVQSEGTKILRQSRRSEASMSDKEEDTKKRKPSTEAELHATGGKKKRK